MARVNLRRSISKRSVSRFSRVGSTRWALAGLLDKTTARSLLSSIGKPNFKTRHLAAMLELKNKGVRFRYTKDDLLAAATLSASAK